MHNSDQQKLHTGLRFFANKRFPGAPVGGLQLRPRQNRFSFSQRNDSKITLKNGFSGDPTRERLKIIFPQPPARFAKGRDHRLRGPRSAFLQIRAPPQSSQPAVPCRCRCPRSQEWKGEGGKEGNPRPPPKFAKDRLPPMATVGPSKFEPRPSQGGSSLPAVVFIILIVRRSSSLASS